MADKLKTVGKVARINKLVHEDADVKTFLNTNEDLMTCMATFQTILASIRTSVGMPALVAPGALPAFPCPQSRWEGRLSYDVTDDTHLNKAGKKDYPGLHTKAMRTLAATFRDVTNTTIEVYRSEGDLLNLDRSLNPGGVTGTHYKVVAP